MSQENVEITHVPACAVVASITASCFAHREERVPFDIGIGQRDQPRRVARAKRVQNLASQLHVLLRHRPRSIPQAQGSA